MLPSIFLNKTNDSCSFPLLQNQATRNNEQAILYVCIIASIIHTIFWLQLVFFPSLRQKSMQWIYAYLITDILLLFRFFFIYIGRTMSNNCISNRIWALFICYFEATVDNYLNILEVYILLALNICRYIQIAYNRNLYITNIGSLIFTHIIIYLLPLISLIIQFLVNWVQLQQFIDGVCDVLYMNIYIQIFNMLAGFALPIILNILVIYASVRRVRLLATLGKSQHHVSAREKYHRSLVIQFLVFYIIWVTLWSPNVIIYQISVSIKRLTDIVRLLNFIEIALDPIIIAGLDVRFWYVWRKVWLNLKKKYLKKLRQEERQIRPIDTAFVLQQLRDNNKHV